MEEKDIRGMLDQAADHQRCGDLLAALSLYDAVIKDQPSIVEVHISRGNVLQALGRLTEAIGAFDGALTLAPKDSITHFNRANALRLLGRSNEALEAYEVAISFKPNFSEAHLNRGVVLKGLGRLESALDAYDAALVIRPDFSLAHYCRGIVLQDMERLEDALLAYNSAIAVAPDYAKAHNNRGNVLQRLERNHEAIDAYRKALQIAPKYPEALSNYGNLLRSAGEFDVALECFDSALRLNPSFAEAHLNRAATLQELGFLHKARQACEAALEIDPKLVGALLNRAGILKDLGDSSGADKGYSELIALKPKLAVAHSNRLFSLHYWEKCADGKILDAARTFGEEFESSFAKAAHLKCRGGKRRLRIGYVSADFRRHSVGFFLQSVFLNHSREQFEIVCYYSSHQWDDLTADLFAVAAQWKNIVGWSDEVLADCVRADGIDILVDLSGHSDGNRLLAFAHRPAPIQLSWLGYFGTTGLTEMDFVLGDQFVTPVGSEAEFVEKIWRLPNSYLCYTAPKLAVSAVEDVKDTGRVTFASFNNVAKISSSAIKLWASVLKSVPGSRLMLMDKSFSEFAMQELFRRRFRAHGITPDRLSLERSVGRKEYLESYNQIDIALDPMPYGGGTTTADALWMGVPVVTLTGGTWAGRISTSILRAIGLPEFIARNEDEYVLISVALAENAERRVHLRRHLRTTLMESTFCNGEMFTRNLEAAYCEMWAACDVGR